MTEAANLWTTFAAPAGVVPLSELPASVDVAIVGGGYTGLSAARTLARLGVPALVLERETLGFGASSRNGGFVLSGYKPDAEELVRRYGLEKARVLWRFALEAVDFVERTAAEEHIDCDFRRTGHLELAAHSSHLPGLEKSARTLRERFGHETVLLEPGQIQQEIQSSRYHGGLLDPNAAAVQPAALCAGLVRAASRAGAAMIDRCAVRLIRPVSNGFTLETSMGSIKAREVLLATNGYGDRINPEIARRVVPVGSYIIATAQLDEERARRLIPRGRVMSDTKNLLYYFRVWNRRLVFGGRASFAPDAERESREILRAGIREVFPDLADIPIDFAWGGRLGFARDHMPHAGRFGGVHYALGYAGHGVALATYLGHRMGEWLAGSGDPPPLCDIPFPAIPFYRGTPWFLPLAGAYYRVRDWLG